MNLRFSNPRARLQDGNVLGTHSAQTESGLLNFYMTI